jgi:hypothetical protein
MADHYPRTVRTELAAFARTAFYAGDGRWKPLAETSFGGELLSREKRGREPRLATFPALMPRLRAAFGVGVKADVLAVLIAMGGADATVRELVRATGYTAAAVRRATQEMVAARVARGTSGRPTAYHVDPAVWASFLGYGPDANTGWRHFAELFAFLAAVVEWGGEEEDGYLAASSARDIFDAHRPAFEANRIPFAEPDDAPGARYLDAFGETVRALASWLAATV